MQTKTMSPPALPVLLLLLFLVAAGAGDDDAKRDDQRAPKSQSCNNPFQLVKVENWIDGVEGRIYNGVTARFGTILPQKPENSVRTPAIFSNPVDCCSNSTSKLSGSVALCMRGGCDFTVKAEFAQSGGATGMLVINDAEDLFEMVCSNSSEANISIPVVMITKSAGESLNKSLISGRKVEILLYAPPRPLVDFSVAFLWLMSVGTIVCASLWSDLTTPEKSDERYNELCPKESSNAATARDDFDKEIVNIDSKGAIIFVIAASIFLVLLFFFMSSWFVWVLIVLFCIGGIEGMHNCILSLTVRKCQDCSQKTVSVPLFGETSIFSLVVLLFCVAFAIFWAATRQESYSWVGQDILGICLMITVLQLARLPNIKVATVLLCCAFVYDIFWVFISPVIFHESVMIAVARGDKAVETPSFSSLSLTFIVLSYTLSAMELGSILHFLQDKTILITGATGFLAKVLLEKILRVQPNVKKLYLLLRAADAKSATHRLHNEIIAKDLFRVLKEKMGANFNSLILEKLTLVPGDISREDLGLEDTILREEIYDQTDVIINLAATTNFDERYDISLGLNTFGVKYVINFAKKCTKLEVLVHVSTAYVSGEGGEEGLILEKPYHLGDSLNGVSGLDINAEDKLVREKLTELQQLGATEKEIKEVMKDLGLSRAKLYGWPNTYVFTKAMGEMLVEQLKGNLSVVIIRPTIVTSTFKEPFPGWAEGVRTIDSLAVAYGKGKLTCFLGDLKAIVDAIPADMVVNAILVAMAAHANRPTDDVIYHVGSSVRKPLRYNNLQDYGFRYFTAKPWINKDGSPVKVDKVTVLNNMDSFRRYMFRYLLVLKGLEIANTAFCQYFQGTYLNLNRKVQIVMRLVDLYKPYLFFRAAFDDMNTEKLRMAARQGGVETDLFYFDPQHIEWDDYFLNIHLPGVVKYIFK